VAKALLAAARNIPVATRLSLVNETLANHLDLVVFINLLV